MSTSSSPTGSPRGRARYFRRCRNCAPSFAARSISATSMSTRRPRPASWSRAPGRVSCNRSPNSRSASWSICRAAFRARPPTIMPRASPRSSWAGNWPAAASASSAMAASAAIWPASPRCWAWKFWSPIPLRPSAIQDFQHVPLDDLLARSDFVVCLAVANEQTENLIGQAALARMQRACVLHQSVARQSRRRGGAVGGVAREPHRRRCDGCRPRAGPDAVAGTGAIAERHRDAAYRRTDAAGDREPVAGNGSAGREDHRGRGPGWRRQCRPLDAPAMNNDLPCSYNRWTSLPRQAQS